MPLLKSTCFSCSQSVRQKKRLFGIVNPRSEPHRVSTGMGVTSVLNEALIDRNSLQIKRVEQNGSTPDPHRDADYEYDGDDREDENETHSNRSYGASLGSSVTEDLLEFQQLIRDHNIIPLKKLVRHSDWPIDHSIRSHLWIELCALQSKGNTDETINRIKRGIPMSPSQALMEKTPGSSESQGKDSKKLPSFIDVTYCRFFHLNQEGQKSVETIIWSLARDHPEMTFCPLIYPMTALFLHYMTPLTAFNCISQLIRANTPPTRNFIKNKSSSQNANGNLPSNLVNNGSINSAINSQSWAKNKKTSSSIHKKNGMLMNGGSESQRNHFETNGMLQSLLPKSKGQISKDAFVLIKLSNSFYVKFWPQRGLIKKQREQLSKKNDIDPAILEWLKWIFIGLPFPHVVRIMDCFLVEGFKFLIRIGLALLVLYKRSEGSSHQEHLTLDQMIAFCERITLTPSQLITLACSLSRLTSSKIVKQYRKAEDVVRRNPDLSCPTPQESPVAIRRGDMIKRNDVQISSRVAPRNLGSSIIDWYLLGHLWEWIPDRIAVKEPYVAFSTNEDGCALQTLFNKTKNLEPTVLLIKTEDGDAFGAYCSESWNTGLQLENGRYFGTGETFLFTLRPTVTRYLWSEVGIEKRDSLNHASQLFMTAGHDHIIVGSGNGSGIWLYEDLHRGKTERCDTFCNEPLARTKDFICTVVEVIAFR